MVYQPIVSWSRREVVAHEALLRTGEAPDHCPAGLFGSARRLGIAGRLGHRVRSSIAQSIPQLPPSATVFVNIEREDLATEALLLPDDPLARFAERIVLEVNEGGQRGDSTGLGEYFEPLRELGYRIALDDLGAGQNGFAAFAEDEFDVAKIDMSLVRGVAESRTKQRVVQFIYELCASEGVLCITEGVETAAELEVLVRLGGDVFQGYLFGRPACVDTPQVRGAG